MTITAAAGRLEASPGAPGTPRRAWPRSMHAVVLLAALLAWSAGVARAAGPAVAASPIAAVTPRIFNGSPTSGHPEVALLGFRQADGDVGTCSGTLIAPTVVLTAAHCLDGAGRSGAVFFPTGDPDTRLEMLARELVPHPDYRSGSYADLALMYLTSPAGGILPAMLPSRRPRGGRAEIVGFGMDGASTALVKRTGTVKLRRRCPRRARRRLGLGRGELRASVCWKPRRRSADTCIGDSGGPVVLRGEVVGVHSAKITRSALGCPSILSWSTDVAYFRDWIDAELAREAER